MHTNWTTSEAIQSRDYEIAVDLWSIIITMVHGVLVTISTYPLLVRPLSVYSMGDGSSDEIKLSPTRIKN